MFCDLDWPGLYVKSPALSFSNPQLSSFGERVPSIASDSGSWLTGVAFDGVFCLCSPSASGFDVLHILRCYDGYLSNHNIAVRSNQRCHCPRTSLIHKVLSPAELASNRDQQKAQDLLIDLVSY